jgi:hypothetical protein
VGFLVVAVMGYTAPVHAQGFMGMTLGESADQVLWKSGRSLALESVPLVGNKRIINDTVPVGPCGSLFRRSLGFSKENTLTVVGLTHKTTFASLDSVASCAMDWIQSSFGPSTEVLTKDSVVMHEWSTREGAVITLEAKAYNERDHFVLIYYYRRDK